MPARTAGGRIEECGVVVIGRNEGERLRVCLTSILRQAGQVVYVDSGSTDGSVELARELGADVVALDLRIPFTAARARNEGVARLTRLYPALRFVQVVDGDCELVAGWVGDALAAMGGAADIAVVFGQRQERFPQASVYNELCDLEWRRPAGFVRSCGGDALIRLQAFAAVEGYEPSLIAGEEPEMCFRMRRRGWRILCLDRPMTVHDAAMTRFGQFYRRSVRSGHAYAEYVWMYGPRADPHQIRCVLSNLFWGLLLPAAALLGAWPTGGMSLLLLLGYPALFFRMRANRRGRGDSAATATAYAGFGVLTKFVETIGMLTFFVNRKLLRRDPLLIEYKGAADSSAR